MLNKYGKLNSMLLNSLLKLQPKTPRYVFVVRTVRSLDVPLEKRKRDVQRVTQILNYLYSKDESLSEKPIQEYYIDYGDVAPQLVAGYSPASKQDMVVLYGHADIHSVSYPHQLCLLVHMEHLYHCGHYCEDNEVPSKFVMYYGTRYNCPTTKDDSHLSRLIWLYSSPWGRQCLKLHGAKAYRKNVMASLIDEYGQSVVSSATQKYSVTAAMASDV